MSHRYHPDPDQYHDDKEAFLFDDCEDCERHTRALGLSLDPSNWWKMWNRMLAVEIEDTEAYRSHNEKLLGSQLYYMYVALERYVKIDPKLHDLGIH